MTFIGLSFDLSFALPDPIRLSQKRLAKTTGDRTHW